MLDAFIKLLEKLIKWGELREKRSEKIYETVAAPLMTELEAVHQDYLALFQKCSDAIESGDSLTEIASIIERERKRLAGGRKKLSILADNHKLYGSPIGDFCYEVYEYFGDPRRRTIASAYGFAMGYLHVNSAANGMIKIDSEETAQMLGELRAEERMFDSYSYFKFASDHPDQVTVPIAALAKSLLETQISNLEGKWEQVCKAYAKLTVTITKADSFK